ncbi:hypothetical protein Lalb_Chr04g0262481 [Lupinus albus]|uniref:Uncharacterized protein n=1 Tax=Lupinus albus TaxID=3870 RepID=A0A6A4QQJ9_LUPAL|nr:hypothetical protein Lalb_Chr04g0262481 [Lupinus albus]
MTKQIQDIKQEMDGQTQIRKDDNMENHVTSIGQSVQNTSSKLAGQATAILQQASTLLLY